MAHMCNINSPINNENVALLGKLQQPLRMGSKIKISGSMKHGGDDRFVVNLQSGMSINPQDDTALHLSVRPKQGTIVRNHFQNGWGGEENSSHCPISQGQNYDIEINVGHDSFRITVNGVHYCDFRYRMPFARINFINIQGQTSINYIGVN